MYFNRISSWLLILFFVLLASSNSSALPIKQSGPIGIRPHLIEHSARMAGDDYHVKWVSDGQWRAHNPKQNIHAIFDATGVSLMSQSNVAVSMSLKAWGYGDKLLSAHSVIPQIDNVKVNYDHGDLQLWYINAPMGLEQGFTIQAPKDNPNLTDDYTLIIKLANTGLSELNTGIFTSQNNTIIYDQFLAFDAKDQQLPITVEAKINEIELKIDTHNATFPIVVDPLFHAEQAVSASDASISDWFGYHVAASGNTVVAGAYRNDQGAIATDDHGAAYVFEKNAEGVWQQKARLTASDANIQDYFGVSVAVYEDPATNKVTIVIGAYNADLPSGQNNPCDPANCFANAGAAYIFVKPDTGWPADGAVTETAKLIPGTLQVGGLFARSVAIFADTIAVGAYGINRDLQNTATGALYIFTKPANGWAGELSPNATLTVGNAVANDLLGISVSMGPDTIIGGAHTADHLDANSALLVADAGAVYVFVKPAGGWVSTDIPAARLIANDAFTSDILGVSVAISGDAVIAGAPGTNVNTGTAYLFLKPIDGWQPIAGVTRTLSQAAILNAQIPEQNAFFGRAVNILGSSAIVGARKNDVIVDKQAVTDAGAAYVFSEPAGGWQAIDSQGPIVLFASDAKPISNFGGGGVALLNDLAIVGAFADGNDLGGVDGLFPGTTYFYTTSVDLALEMTPSKTQLGQPGEQVEIFLKLTNNDPLLDATGVEVSSTLPSGLTFDFVSPTNLCAFSANTDTVNCQFGTITANSTIEAVIGVVVDNLATYNLSATASTSRFDLDKSNNSVNITLLKNNPPSKPLLLSPSDNETGVSQDPVFIWQKSDDIDNDVLNYQVHLCQDVLFVNCTPLSVTSLDITTLNFTNLGSGLALFFIIPAFIRIRTPGAKFKILAVSILLLPMACNNAFDDTTNIESNEIQLSVSGLNPNALYFWKVSVDDGNNGIAESEVRTFTTL